MEFAAEGGPLRAVDGVSFAIRRGEIVGLVGESGAGKSLTAEAVLGLIRCPPGRVTGEVRLRGRDLLALDEGALARIRGKDIAMIFQNPGASLNPVFRVGSQVLEAMTLHLDEPRPALRRRVVEILTRVGIRSAAARARDYPHQFSGGMAQRVMVGMGMSCVPSLLIADEPTTALDVTIQAQVLALIRRLARETGTAVLLVSHDLGVISQMCHRVLVMYAGRLVEAAPIGQLFRAPVSPVHARAHRLCAPRGGHGPARRHRRGDAGPSRHPRGLPVPSALRGGGVALRQRRADGADGRVRARGRLPPGGPMRPRASGEGRTPRAGSLWREPAGVT